MNAQLNKHPLILAIALSLLLHAALLFGPNLVKIPPRKIPLPLLTAQLEPLPAVKKPRPRPHPKPRLKPHPKLVTAPLPVAQIPVEAIPVIAKPGTEMALASAATSAAESAPVEAAASAAEAAPVETPAKEIKPAHPLPRHAQLTFIAYKGTNLPVGKALHLLDINDDKKYLLQTVINTTGIASLFKTFVMNRQSTGKVTAQGLQPDEFTESRLTSRDTQTQTAKFDWQNKQLNFSAGDHAPLPEQTQDMLSFLYQFSQMPLDQPILTMHVSNGRKLESYQLEVGAEEEIRTPLGKLRALPLRKIHAPGEEGLEIWLGLEYRLLPVKVVQIDRRGEVAGELDISEIRVSDEQKR